MPDGDAFGVGGVGGAGGATATADAFGVGSKPAGDAFGVSGRSRGQQDAHHTIDALHGLDRWVGHAAANVGSTLVNIADKPLQMITDVSQALQRPVGAAVAGRDARTAAHRVIDPSHQAEDDRDGLERLAAAAHAGAFATMPGSGPVLNALLRHAALKAMPPEIPPTSGRLDRIKNAAARVGTGLGNAGKSLAYEIGTDPVTLVPGLDVLSGVAKAAKLVGKIPAVAHGLEDATMGLRADSALVRDATPATRAAVQQSEIAAHNMKLRHQAEHKQVVEEDRTALNTTGMTPRARRLLQRDAWLNGTESVRKKLLADGFKPTSEEQLAPVLNIQTAYKKDYDPHGATFADEFDPAHRYVASATFGPNLGQHGLTPTSPLADRVERRLAVGWSARHAAQDATGVGTRDLYQQRFALDAIGLKGDRPRTALLEAAIKAERGEPTPDFLRVQQLEARLGQRKDQQELYDGLSQQLWSPRGNQGRAETKQIPGTVDLDQIERRMGPIADGLKLSAQDTVQLAHALRSETGQVTLPAAMAARLMNAKSAEFGKNFLEQLSDAARNALFVIPFAHMKNISTLQAEGPGGAGALAAGALLYTNRHKDPAAWEARKAELQRMGATVEFTDDPVAKVAADANPVARGANAYARFTQAAQKPANGMLWDWDLAQRMALKDHLETNPLYQHMTDYEKGAVINATLFNYYHQSSAARVLRTIGAPFPHWRLGNLERQGRQLLDNPRPIEAYARAVGVLNRSVFPDVPYDLEPGTPIDEGARALIRPWSYFLATVGGVAADQGRQPADAQERLQMPSITATAQALGGSYLPGGATIPTLIEALGDKAIGGALGADRFHSKAPAELRAAGGLVGAYTTNEPSSYRKAIRELLREHPEWTKIDAERALRLRSFNRAR